MPPSIAWVQKSGRCILASFGLSEEDSRVYQIVKTKFEAHFVKKRNVVFERAKFNIRKREVLIHIITVLYKLSEHCGYGLLRNELI